MSHNGQTYVSSRTNRGIRVFSPQNPRVSHYVNGDAAEPSCTCDDFGQNGECGHVSAAVHLLPSNGSGDKADGCKGAQMVIKRSVSPDGRIDSMSIEFTCDVSSALVSEIRSRAERTLALQTSLIQSFLAGAAKVQKQPSSSSPVVRTGNGQNGNGHNGNGRNGNGNGHTNEHHGNGAVPASLVSIRGMNTRFGYKTFVDVECEGQTIKLFGSKKQLAEALVAAGFPHMSRNISDGVELGLPCRVVINTTGQYPKIEKVMPAQSNGSKK